MLFKGQSHVNVVFHGLKMKRVDFSLSGTDRRFGYIKCNLPPLKVQSDYISYIMSATSEFYSWNTFMIKPLTWTALSLPAMEET